MLFPHSFEKVNLSSTLIIVSGSHVFSQNLHMGKGLFYYLGLDTRVFEDLMNRSQKLSFQSLKVFLSLLCGESRHAPVAHNFFRKSQKNGSFNYTHVNNWSIDPEGHFEVSINLFDMSKKMFFDKLSVLLKNANRTLLRS